METVTDEAFTEAFEGYPEPVREKLLFLRRLVLEAASETEGVDSVEETLKWGEPSFLTARGSTVRIGWKESEPDRYAMYFHCLTSLVDTFREIYRDEFAFEGNRAIVFHLDDEVPVDELKHCVSLALTYHDRKHLTLLGA